MEEAAMYAKKNGFAFIETSALDSSNVENAFMSIIKEIYKLTVVEEEQEAPENTQQFRQLNSYRL